jgi:hypothetical protein
MLAERDALSVAAINVALQLPRTRRTDDSRFRGLRITVVALTRLQTVQRAAVLMSKKLFFLRVAKSPEEDVFGRIPISDCIT